MANRAFLIQSSSPTPVDCDPDRDILAASNYSIPVFWFALFDADSILKRPIQSEDGTSASYPYLVASVIDARKRFDAKRGRLFKVIPPSFQPLADDFIRLFDSIDGTHIHLDPMELWMMDEPDKYLPQLKNYLSAFDIARPFSLVEWRELLRQAEIDIVDVAGSVESYKLTGSSSVRPVTWKE